MNKVILFIILLSPLAVIGFQTNTLDPVIEIFLPKEMATGNVALAIANFQAVQRAVAAKTTEPEALFREREKLQAASGTNYAKYAAYITLAEKAAAALPILFEAGALAKTRTRDTAMALAGASFENSRRFAVRYAEHFRKLQILLAKHGVKERERRKVAEVISQMSRPSSTSVVMALATLGIESPDSELVTQILALGSPKKSAKECEESYKNVLEKEGLPLSLAPRIALILDGPFE